MWGGLAFGGMNFHVSIISVFSTWCENIIDSRNSENTEIRPRSELHPSLLVSASNAQNLSAKRKPIRRDPGAAPFVGVQESKLERGGSRKHWLLVGETSKDSELQDVLQAHLKFVRGGSDPSQPGCEPPIFGLNSSMPSLRRLVKLGLSPSAGLEVMPLMDRMHPRSGGWNSHITPPSLPSQP